MRNNHSARYDHFYSKCFILVNLDRSKKSSRSPIICRRHSYLRENIFIVSAVGRVSRNARCCPEVLGIGLSSSSVLGKDKRKTPHDHANHRRVIYAIRDRPSVTGLPATTAVVRSATAVSRVGRLHTPGVRHTARAVDTASERTPYDTPTMHRTPRIPPKTSAAVEPRSIAVKTAFLPTRVRKRV